MGKAYDHSLHLSDDFGNNICCGLATANKANALANPKWHRFHVALSLALRSVLLRSDSPRPRYPYRVPLTPPPVGWIEYRALHHFRKGRLRVQPVWKRIDLID